MERKPKRRTRERILDAALRLFNQFGEPNVSTNLIADEIGISPGNLYYHFRSKDELIESLFDDFRREIENQLSAPTRRAPDVEDIWLYLHVVFELIWKYRFLYRDLNDLLSRNRKLEIHFKEIIAHSERTALALCEGLAAHGQMRAAKSELAALVTNIVVVATYWLSYEYVRSPRQQDENAIVARGAFQVMALAAPFLVGEARELFEKLANTYVAE